MILSDIQILAELGSNIKIEPFNPECLGSNSYDVHLGAQLGVYEGTVEKPLVPSWGPSRANGAVLDAKKRHALRLFEIPECGLIMYPDILYLGVTEEYTETHEYTPWLDGKSSGGRLGISVHATAGRGDVGFMNHWTLELSCIQPVRIYAGMPIAQITYFVTGPVGTPYTSKDSAKYRERSVEPVASAMWKNFDKETGKWK